MPKDWVESRKTICLDFNGVLDQYQGWKGPDFMYEPRPGVVDFLKSLKELGYRIVIMTAADCYKIQDWFIEYGLFGLIDSITNEKVPALIYVDDRAITFQGDFNQTLEQIATFKTFWEDAKHQEGGKI